MIAVVDYGAGNLFSLKSSLSYLGLTAEVTGDPAKLKLADAVILPGVGAFSDAMAKLQTSGLVPALLEQCREGKPFLGICLGHQLLFSKSFEYGETRGLDVIGGSVCDITPQCCSAHLKVPHMGWNSLDFVKPSPIFKYLSSGEYVYFVHSFAATDCDEAVTAVADYGGRVAASVQKDNVFGCQFHPEKSGDAGLRILKAFGELV